jgi:Na+/H+ antiporter NhaA
MSDAATDAHARPFSGRTAWARSVQTPLRAFLRTETAGAAVLLAAAVVALAWVNADASSYDSLSEGLSSAISPNERLQLLYNPWTSYLIVLLFALAKAGIRINGGFLERAVTSPITLGILVGYVVGKPVGILGGASLVTRVSGGRLRPPVG